MADVPGFDSHELEEKQATPTKAGVPGFDSIPADTGQRGAPGPMPGQRLPPTIQATKPANPLVQMFTAQAPNYASEVATAKKFDPLAYENPLKPADPEEALLRRDEQGNPQYFYSGGWRTGGKLMAGGAQAATAYLGQKRNGALGSIIGGTIGQGAEDFGWRALGGVDTRTPEEMEQDLKTGVLWNTAAAFGLQKPADIGTQFAKWAARGVLSGGQKLKSGALSLFKGDVTAGIKPNLGMYMEDTNPVKESVESAAKGTAEALQGARGAGYSVIPPGSFKEQDLASTLTDYAKTRDFNQPLNKALATNTSNIFQRNDALFQQMRGQVDAQMGSAKQAVTPLINAYQKKLGLFNDLPNLGKTLGIGDKDWKQYEDIMANGGQMTWPQLRYMQSKVGAAMRDLNPNVRGDMTMGELRGLYKTLKDTTNSILAKKGPNILELETNANKLMENSMDLGESVKKFAGAVQGKQMFDAMGNPTNLTAPEIQNLKRILPPDLFNSSMRHMVDVQAWNPARMVAGKLNPGVDYEKLLDNYANTPDDVKHLIYGAPGVNPERTVLDIATQRAAESKLQGKGNPIAAGGSGQLSPADVRRLRIPIVSEAAELTKKGIQNVVNSKAVLGWLLDTQPKGGSGVGNVLSFLGRMPEGVMKDDLANEVGAQYGDKAKMQVQGKLKTPTI